MPPIPTLLDPEDTARLKRYCDMTAEVAEFAMDLFRAAAPGAKAEAESRSSYAVIEQQDQQREIERQQENARRAQIAAKNLPPEMADMAERALTIRPLPSQDALRICLLPPGPTTAIGIVAFCTRVIRNCAETDLELTLAIAQASGAQARPAPEPAEPPQAATQTRNHPNPPPIPAKPANESHPHPGFPAKTSAQGP